MEYLRTYRRVLAQYHLHPEAKFLYADFLDSGPTQRRHVVVGAKDVRCFGKEANRWEEQAATGENPEAQTEYVPDVDADELRSACEPFKVRELAPEAGVSPSTVSSFVRAKSGTDWATIAKLQDAVDRLAVRQAKHQASVTELLARVREYCHKESLVQYAVRAGVDRRTLQAVLAGHRQPSSAMLDRLNCSVMRRRRPMFVFEVTTPGTWLDHEDRAWSFRVQVLLDLLKSKFLEASAALNLFVEACSVRRPSPDPALWERDRSVAPRFERRSSWNLAPASLLSFGMKLTLKPRFALSGSSGLRVVSHEISNTSCPSSTQGRFSMRLMALRTLRVLSEEPGVPPGPDGTSWSGRRLIS